MFSDIGVPELLVLFVVVLMSLLSLAVPVMIGLLLFRILKKVDSIEEMIKKGK